MNSKNSAKHQLHPGFSLLTVLLLCSTSAKAELVGQEFHPLEDISQTAIAEVTRLVDSSSYATIEINSQRLDERLRLRQCELPLEASVNSGTVKAGRTSVQIRCPGVKAWSLYVPVTVEATTQVVMVKGPLPRGTILTAEHLQLREMPVSQLPANYLSQIEDVQGQELNRFVNNESFVTAFMIKIRNLVEKGQEVVILASSSTLEVRMAGIALEPGQQGERIRVKNSASGKTIEGMISAEGTIKVSL